MVLLINFATENKIQTGYLAEENVTTGTSLALENTEDNSWERQGHFYSQTNKREVGSGFLSFLHPIIIVFDSANLCVLLGEGLDIALIAYQ